MICHDTDYVFRSVVSALCQGLAETTTTVSLGVVEGHLDKVSELAIQILEQKSLCQQDPDQDEDDEPLEDQAEYESVLISSAGDVVAALAQVLGPDFSQAFQKFFPSSRNSTRASLSFFMSNVC